MPRYQRDTFLHGYTYHIYNVTAGNTTLFREEVDYENFIAKYTKYLAPYFDTYAYCLIPNHHHIIAKVKESFLGIIDQEDTIASKNYIENKITEGDFLENQLSRMFSSISIAYNNKYKRKGPLF
ncbi:MAG: putative transposase [Saprospiraceae bacterium]|jgi:putative transposase